MKLRVAVLGIIAVVAVFVLWPYGAWTDIRSSGPASSYTVVRPDGYVPVKVSYPDAPTTGTVEEVLDSVTLPTGALNPGSIYCGLKVDAYYSAEANTNSKTTQIKIGGLTGSSQMGRTFNAAANIQAGHRIELLVATGSYVDLFGWGWSYIANSTTQQYTTGVAVGVIDFSTAVEIAATGTTPTAAGDLRLLNFGVWLLRCAP